MNDEPINLWDVEKNGWTYARWEAEHNPSVEVSELINAIEEAEEDLNNLKHELEVAKRKQING